MQNDVEVAAPMTEKAILIAMPMAPHMYGDMDPRKSSIDNRKPWPVMIATSPEGGTGGGGGRGRS